MESMIASLPVKRSNPSALQAFLDCFVASRLATTPLRLAFC
jgi:hypothetical protein